MAAGSSGKSRSNTSVRPAERARKAAAEARQAAQQRERRRLGLQLGAAVAVGAALVAVAVLWARASDPPGATTEAALRKAGGLGAEQQPPWPAPQDVPSRTRAAALSLGPMGTAEHYHAHLDVIVNGEEVPVPANIGVDPSTGMMTGLHTHTPDGVVHIEASRPGQFFTLGQLFTEWNVRLTATRIGGLEATGDNELTAFVNGEPVPGNPASVRFAPRQQITLVYGPAGQQVDVPDSYDFAPGQ